MVQISEVKGNSRENRTAAHSHIKGLGLRSDGYAEKTGAGFVGQAAAREVRLFSLSDAARVRQGCFTDCRNSAGLGMRCCRRPHQSEEDVRASGAVSRGPGHRQDGAGAGSFAGAGDQGAVLSDCWERDLFGRGQEDGGADGELSTGYRSVTGHIRGGRDTGG